MPIVFAIVHLVVAAAWVGSMAYSLIVVQPKVAAFFTDDVRREEFLTVLAQGNRWRVVGLIIVLLLSGTGVVLTAPSAAAVGFGVALALEVVAAVIFVEVSWRHWPARVFALSQEIPGFQRALRVRARCMLGLVGLAFLVALGSAVGLGVR
jgi:putative copper export protein